MILADDRRMRASHRRVLLVLGVLMLVGGWGTTRYADARQAGLSERSRDKAWRGDGDFVSGWVLFSAGILVMGVGAVVVVFSRD